MSTTGDPRCTCSDQMTAGKPWCPIHDNYAGTPTEQPAVEIRETPFVPITDRDPGDEWGHRTWCLNAPVFTPCICERRSGEERRRKRVVGDRTMRQCFATCVTSASDGATYHAPGCPQTQPFRSGTDRRSPPREPEREAPRELLCMICGCDYPVWFAPNDLWNRVVRLPDGSDRWPFLCPTCFGMKAVEAGVSTPFILAEGEVAVGSHAYAEILTAENARLRARLRTIPERSPEEREGSATPVVAAHDIALSALWRRAHDLGISEDEVFGGES